MGNLPEELRERIKLTANYANGCSIVFVAGSSITVPLWALSTGHYKLGAGLIVLFYIAGWVFHRQAYRSIALLKAADYDPAKPTGR